MIVRKLSFLSFLFLILHILLSSNSWCMFGTYCYLEQREGGMFAVRTHGIHCFYIKEGRWCWKVSTSGQARAAFWLLVVLFKMLNQSRQKAHVNTDEFSNSVKVLMQIINSTLWTNEHISWGFLCKPLCWGFPAASHREQENMFAKDIQDKLFLFRFDFKVHCWLI